MMTHHGQLDQIVTALQNAGLPLNTVHHHQEWGCVLLNCKFLVGDVYARVYTDQDTHGQWHSVLYPQTYGNIHAFRVDQNRLFDMGAYISVPINRVVEQVERWIEIAAAWNQEWVDNPNVGYLEH